MVRVTIVIMSVKNSNVDSILAPLKELSNVHGGKYFVHFDQDHNCDTPRGYWLIFESMFHLPGGTFFRSSQIHNSWAMQSAMFAKPRQMRKLPFYSMTYIHRGSGRYYDANHPKGIVLSAGDLICMFPGQPHVYGPDQGTRWDEININFTGEVFHGWIGQNLLDPMEPIRRLESVEHWLTQIHQLVLPLAKPGRKPAITDTGRLLDLLSRMCLAWQTPWEDAQVLWLEKAQKKLRDWPLDEPLELKQLTRVFGYSEQTYRRKFKRLSGMTPLNYRMRYVIEMACHRLRDTSIPLKQIADDLGFGSEYYFSRRFKQIAGMPPGAYREKSVTG